MERLKGKTAVYIIVERNDQILFLRRYNTGWHDGYFTLPSGHIDQGELPIQAAIRELKEEVDLTVQSDDLEFSHVLYERDEYIDFFFKYRLVLGEARLAEPESSDRIIWLGKSNLAIEKVIPKVKYVLAMVESKKVFSEILDGANNK